MKKLVMVFFVVMLLRASGSAQTTVFTYQGNLKSSGSAANGNYDFEFKLFDAVSGGVQQGSALQRLNVAVANGVFAVSLNFGVGTLPGADRFLEIGVRASGSPGGFQQLLPRQQVASTPYSVKSLVAEDANNAITASVANDTTHLGGIDASQYVVTTDTRMSDARPPTPGSTNYIQNGVSQQGGNFNINGDGVIGQRVGIGSLFGNYKLNITGSGIIRARINSDSNAGVALVLNDQPKWSVATVNGGDFQIYNDSNNQGAMSINATTNVISGNGAGLTNVTSATKIEVSVNNGGTLDVPIPGGFTLNLGCSGDAAHRLFTLGASGLGAIQVSGIKSISDTASSTIPFAAGAGVPSGVFFGIGVGQPNPGNTSGFFYRFGGNLVLHSPSTVTTVAIDMFLENRSNQGTCLLRGTATPSN